MSAWDPVTLEVFRNLFYSVAEEMGVTLCRTSFSPNIKERRDYSCAIFDDAGRMVAQGEHMPVHLGSMPMSVAAAIDTLFAAAPTCPTSPWSSLYSSTMPMRRRFSSPTAPTIPTSVASPPARCRCHGRSIRKVSAFPPSTWCGAAKPSKR